MLSIVCFLFLSSSHAQNYHGPNNKAVIMNDVARLECSDVNPSSNISATWKFFPVDSKTDVTIYYNFGLLNKPDHYHVNYSREHGQYDLVINHTRREDAGVYACLVAKKDHRAKLIVLASDPVCETINLEEDGYLQLWCAVTVWGNWLPKMQWSMKGGYPITDGVNETVVNETIIISVLKISVRSLVTNARFVQFVCETFFPPENNLPESQGSRAAPEYRHTWTSPEFILEPDWSTVGADDRDDEGTMANGSINERSIIASSVLLSIGFAFIPFAIVLTIVVMWKTKNKCCQLKTGSEIVVLETTSSPAAGEPHGTTDTQAMALQSTARNTESIEVESEYEQIGEVVEQDVRGCQSHDYYNMLKVDVGNDPVELDEIPENSEAGEEVEGVLDLPRKDRITGEYLTLETVSRPVDPPPPIYKRLSNVTGKHTLNIGTRNATASPIE